MTNITGNHDNVAHLYDESVLKDFGDYIRENYFLILNRVRDLLDLAPGLHLLDIGIGTGLLLERLPSDLNVSGIDISVKMMEKIKEKGLNVELKYGDFLNIPYADNSFERIVTTFALHHLNGPDKFKALVEMDRVLRPNGLIVVGDFMFENTTQKQALIERFKREERSDMLQEIDDEEFTFIDQTTAFLSNLGYRVSHERGSTLTWIIKAEKING